MGPPPALDWLRHRAMVTLERAGCSFRNGTFIGPARRHGCAEVRCAQAFLRWRRRSMRVIRSASANAAAPRTAMSSRETLAECGFTTAGGLASTAVTDAVWRDRATGSVKLGPPRAGGGTTGLRRPPREVATGVADLVGTEGVAGGLTGGGGGGGEAEAAGAARSPSPAASASAGFGASPSARARRAR